MIHKYIYIKIYIEKFDLITSKYARVYLLVNIGDILTARDRVCKVLYFQHT